MKHRLASRVQIRLHERHVFTLQRITWFDADSTVRYEYGLETWANRLQLRSEFSVKFSVCTLFQPANQMPRKRKLSLVSVATFCHFNSVVFMFAEARFFYHEKILKREINFSKNKITKQNKAKQKRQKREKRPAKRNAGPFRV